MIDLELDRIGRFLRDHQAKSTSRTREWRWGTAYFHEALPLVYDLNFMRLERPDASLDAAGLEQEADRVMGELGHRQIVVDDEALGRDLATGMQQRGWKVNRHVVMAYHGPKDLRPDTSDVVEVTETDVWPSRAKFLRSYEWCRDEEIVAQMHGAYRVWMRAGNGQDFAIIRDGRPVSFALLWMNDGVAQIEDVATLEEFRKRGYSRAVVTKALEEARAAGCDLIFLIADEDDWPKELYARLGFERVGLFSYFVKVNS